MPIGRIAGIESGLRVNGATDIQATYTETINAGDTVGIGVKSVVSGTNPPTQPTNTPSRNGVKISPNGTFFVIVYQDDIRMFKSSDNSEITLPNKPTFTGLLGANIAWSEDESHVFIGLSKSVDSSTVLIWSQSSEVFTKQSSTAINTVINGLDYGDDTLYCSFGITSGNRWVAYPYNESTHTIGSQVAMPNQPISSQNGIGATLSPNGVYVAFQASFGTLNVFKKTGATSFTRILNVTDNSLYSSWNGGSDILVVNTTNSPYYIVYGRSGDVMTAKGTQSIGSLSGNPNLLEADNDLLLIGIPDNKFYFITMSNDASASDVLLTKQEVTASTLEGFDLKDSLNRVIYTDDGDPTINFMNIITGATKIENIAEARNTAFNAIAIARQNGNTNDVRRVTKIIE